MQWNELIEACAQKSGLSVEQTEGLLDTLMNTMVTEISEKRTVCLRPDFGRFEVREHGGEQIFGRNDQYTKLHRTPVFKSSSDLKKKLRQSDEEYIIMLRQKGAHKTAERFAFLVKHAKDRSAG